MLSRTMRVLTTLGLALFGATLLCQSMNPSRVVGANNERSFQQTPIVYPGKNSQTIPSTSTISVSYDEPIDDSTVSTQTFAVHAMQTGLLTQTYDVTNGTISLAPVNRFKPGEIVHATATTGTLYLGSQGPLTPTVWMFRTKVEGGLGTFLNSGQLLDTGRANDVALGDLDGDGDLDAFVTNELIGDSDIFFNDGKGIFSKVANVPSASGVALGDLDGDGDLDAFLIHREGGSDKVFINDGHGNFTDNLQGLGNYDSWDVALGDLNGDGDLDAIVTNGDENQSGTIWVNNGTGIFTEGQPLESEFSRHIALGDLDNDGDLDAFTEGLVDRVYLNNGHGSFQETFQGFGDSYGSDIILGDCDNDRDLDALIADGDGNNRVWLNSGTGIFSQGHFWGSEGRKYSGFDVGDLDNDGDLDVFITEYSTWEATYPNEVWLNDGSAVFTKTNQILDTHYNIHSTAVALGDVDNDGDLDAFIATDLTNFTSLGETFSEVWLNANNQSFIPIALQWSNTLIVRSFIDGRSHLVLQDGSLYWHHLDFAAPGRHEFNDEPTYLTALYRERTAWMPIWPDIPDAENHWCDCDSSSFDQILPLASITQTITMNVIQARDQVTIVQQPRAENDYTLIIEFHDRFDGADWYEVSIDYLGPSGN